MTSRSYDAILLDVDGTILSDSGELHPRNRAALHAAAASGVRVMLATGRSVASTRPVLEMLGLDGPAVVFNGAGLFCPRTNRMLEERTLSNRTLERALRFGRERDLVTVLMTADRKLSSPPRTPAEEQAVRGLHGVEIVPWDELEAEYVVRVTFYSSAHESSAHLSREIEEAIDQPVYMTDFPLNWLAGYRDNRLDVVDLHPPCRGKGEGVRILEERWSIPRERVVAVGDATNDIPMFELVGLAVAMETAMPEAKAHAHRFLPGPDGSALADLVEELFLRA